MMERYTKHRYIGKDTPPEGYTRGRDYFLVCAGNWFFSNAWGGYLTSDDYEGSDVDYCVFFPTKQFNRLFSPPIQDPTVAPRGERLYRKMLHQERRIAMARMKFGKTYVQKELQEGGHGRLVRASFRCRCAYCQDSRRIHSLRKKSAQAHQEKEFLGEE